MCSRQRDDARTFHTPEGISFPCKRWEGLKVFQRKIFYIVLYCVVLYFVVLPCVVLYCVVSCSTVLCCIVLYCIVLYCTVLPCIVPCCVILYCIILHCILLYCTSVFCAVLSRNVWSMCRPWLIHTVERKLKSQKRRNCPREYFFEMFFEIMVLIQFILSLFS